jgi:hypothetical protein
MNLSIKELNELIYSLGITASKGIFVNKELNASLIDKLYSELNSSIEIQSDITDEVLDRLSSHFVSNDEADEDYRSTLIQDSNRYESSVEKDYDNHLAKLNERGYITQALLDYVDRKGAATYMEINNYYKSITGSNSFSHHLYNLMTPYKNRKTQRFLSKEGSTGSVAKYIIKVANPSNWVVK